MVSVFIAVAALAASIWTDGPPAGPSDKALCPVTGQKLNITADTPSVAFHNGQQLYFASDAAASAYRDEPRKYWLAPDDTPLAPPDGIAAPALCQSHSFALQLSFGSYRVRRHARSPRLAWPDPAMPQVRREHHRGHADASRRPQARTGRVFLLPWLHHVILDGPKGTLCVSFGRTCIPCLCVCEQLDVLQCVQHLSVR